MRQLRRGAGRRLSERARRAGGKGFERHAAALLAPSLVRGADSSARRRPPACPAAAAAPCTPRHPPRPAQRCVSAQTTQPRRLSLRLLRRTGSHCTVRLGYSSKCAIAKSYSSGAFFFHTRCSSTATVSSCARCQRAPQATAARIGARLLVITAAAAPHGRAMGQERSAMLCRAIDKSVPPARVAGAAANARTPEQPSVCNDTL